MEILNGNKKAKITDNQFLHARQSTERKLEFKKKLSDTIFIFSGIFCAGFGLKGFLMPKLIPATERLARARKLIQQARALPVPSTGLGKSDFTYIANVKDLMRQAKDMIKFIPQTAGVSVEMKEEVKFNGGNHDIKKRLSQTWRRRHRRLHPRGRVVRHLGLRQLRRKIERDVARQHAARHQRVLAVVELAADRLVVGVEAPRDAAAVEAVPQLGQHAAVAHALDALALVALGHVGADEGEGHRVQLAGEHHVHVVHQLPRDGILVRREAHAERAHRPVHRRPVQGREARADPQRAPA